MTGMEFTTIGMLIAVAMLAVMWLNTAHVPGPRDTSTIMDSALTKAATFAGTVLDLGAGFAPGGVGSPMAASIDISSIETDTGNESYAWVLTECDTSDGSFTACGPTITKTAAAATAVTGMLTVPGFVSKRYVALSLTISGTVATGVTYSSWLIPLGRQTA